MSAEPTSLSARTPTASPTAQASSDKSVSEVDLTDGDQQIPAYLVAPDSANPESAAGIVWFHWLESGDPTSNRTEFLAEAQALANQGVVSVLVDGQFPWHDRPTSTSHDVAGVQSDIDMLKQAVELLKAQPAVDKSRIALVGHDFGAMYSSVVFGEDPSIAALVMMAPTARWGDWFLPYWPHNDNPDSYKAQMKPLDPVTALKKADGRPVLLQFATQDQYVPAATADEIDAAAGSAAQRKDYDAGHQLNDAARADRDAWLTQVLHLVPAGSPTPI
jgi:dienelactone hydrolase